MSDEDRNPDCTSGGEEADDACTKQEKEEKRADGGDVILGLKPVIVEDREADEVRCLTRSSGTCGGRARLSDSGVSGSERLSFTEANLGQSPSVDLFGRFESFSLTRGSECDSDLLSTSSVEEERKVDDKEYVEDWIKTLPDDFKPEPGTEGVEGEKIVSCTDSPFNVELDESVSLDDSTYFDQGDNTLQRRQSEPTRSSVHGAAAAKRRRRPANPEDAGRGEGGRRSDSEAEPMDPIQERITAAQESGSVRLDLNRQGLQEVPSAILELNQLKFLYLEGNELKFLPENLFIRLPSLQWLDLRNNKLTSLPESIGQHTNLKTLLLENNLLEILPNELALMPSLQGLNYRNNPIIDPPPEVLEKGLKHVVDYLRKKMTRMKRNSIENNQHPMEAEETLILDLDRSVRNSPSLKKRSVSWTSSDTLTKGPRRRIPYVMDAEYNGPPLQVLDKKAREEEEKMRQRQEKERIESIIQNVKNSLALKSWRTKAKIEQMKMMKMADNYEGFIAAEAPYDIDEDYLNLPNREEMLKARESNEVRKRPMNTPGYMDAERILKEREVETEIKRHLDRLIETSAQEVIDLDRAARELQEVERLRRHLTNLFRIYY